MALRRVGRQKMRWKDGVDQDMRILEVTNWRKVALDRDEWAKLLNPLNPELNPICYLLALLAQNFLHVSRIRVKQARAHQGMWRQ